MFADRHMANVAELDKRIAWLRQELREAQRKRHDELVDAAQYRDLGESWWRWRKRTFKAVGASFVHKPFEASIGWAIILLFATGGVIVLLTLAGMMWSALLG